VTELPAVPLLPLLLSAVAAVCLTRSATRLFLFFLQLGEIFIFLQLRL
jgi:hypothetical protein